MKGIVVILIIAILISMPFSQGVVIEKNNSIEVVNGSFNITFFKNMPLIEIGINGSVKSFYISSILFDDGTQIQMRGITWQVNFTKMVNGIYDFKIFSHAHEYKFIIEYVLILNGQKYMNYTENGILVHIYIKGKPTSTLIIFEHIIKGRVSILDAQSHDVFNMHEKTMKLAMDSINYYSKNSTFYISSSNNTETNLYQIYQNENGTVQSFSFISFGASQESNFLNTEAIIFTVMGVFVGSIIILSGILYQRKKG